MNDLIKINVNESQEPIVSGRELHEFLGIDTPYTKWFNRMTEYGFTKNVDYVVMDIFVHNSKGGKQTQTNHALKLDMAKELSMIQRTDRGKQARQYFIQVDKEYNSPDKLMARALVVADMQIKQLTEDLTVMKPKADYFDGLVARNLLTNFRETAKELGISEKQFIKDLINLKYIYRTPKGKLLPYTDKNNGLFEVKEFYNKSTGWTGTQTLITPKGRETFRLLFT
jgi:anti-repressor protein